MKITPEELSGLRRAIEQARANPRNEDAVVLLVRKTLLRNILDDFATLKAELASAREMIETLAVCYDSEAASDWLKAHPAPEGEGK